LVGPETRAALARGAVAESPSETARRRQSGAAVGNEGGPQAPSEGGAPSGGVRAGELARDNTVSARGPRGEVVPDGAGGGTARGDLGQVELPNGATVTGPSGQVTVG